MKRPPPPLLTVIAALAQQAWPAQGPAPSTTRRVVATCLAAGSCVLAGGAARQFHVQRTTVEPFDPSKATSLVVSGPNTLTRNPMYVGMAGLLVANAVRRGTWQALLPVASFVSVIDRFQVAAEERALAERFGADYEAYRASVPRWLDRRSVLRRS